MHLEKYHCRVKTIIHYLLIIEHLHKRHSVLSHTRMASPTTAMPMTPSYSCHSPHLRGSDACLHLSGHLADISEWMPRHRLKLNLDKTELEFLQGKGCCQSPWQHRGAAKSDGEEGGSDPGWRTVILGKHHSSSSCRFLLYIIRRIRPFLTRKAAQVLIQALLIFHLDYCNPLLVRAPASAHQTSAVDPECYWPPGIQPSQVFPHRLSFHYTGSLLLLTLTLLQRKGTFYCYDQTLEPGLITALLCLWTFSHLIAQRTLWSLIPEVRTAESLHIFHPMLK